MTDHLSRFWVRPGLIDLVHSSDDVALRELMRELINQQPFRRDLFRRGLLNPGGDAEAERIVRQRVEAAIEKNHGLVVTLGISE